MTIKTYFTMNARIVAILRQDSDPMALYAAQRIEELEAEVEQLRDSLKAILDAATSDHDRDLISSECWSALKSRTEEKAYNDGDKTS